MFILKIKKSGKFVGKKGFRSWDWKEQDDWRKARVFASIGGIKSFAGKRAYWNDETKSYKKDASGKIIQDSNMDKYEVIELEEFIKNQK